MQVDDTASHEQLIAELLDERDRQQRAIAEAKERIEAVDRRPTPLPKPAQRELHDLVLAVYDQLAEMERVHADALFEIHDAAVAEVMRLLDGAHQEVSRIWARTSEVGPTALPAVR